MHSEPAATPVSVNLPEVLLSVTDAAKTLSISKRHCEYLIASGRLGSVKSGRRRLIPFHEVERYVANLEQERPA